MLGECVDMGIDRVYYMVDILQMNQVTVRLAWSAEEAARYLETYKVYENKPSDQLHERHADDYLSQITFV